MSLLYSRESSWAEDASPDVGVRRYPSATRNLLFVRLFPMALKADPSLRFGMTALGH